MIHYRRLSSDDLPAYRGGMQVLGDAFDDPETYHANPPGDEYVARFLANRQHLVLVAESKGEVVGCLVAYVLEKFEQARAEAYVYDLAVAPDWQRRGIGKGLMDLVRAEAKRAGAYLVFVQADEGDEAVAFYEALEPDENLRTRNFDYQI